MAKERTQARREQLAKVRAAQKRKERRAALLMWGTGGLIIAVLVGVVGYYVINERAKSSLDGVTTYSYKGAGHTSAKVTYKENPPVGGEHNPTWQLCKVYDEPVNNENAVHSMEHGAVWITYRPDLPKPQVDKLKALVTTDYMVLSPYPGLSAPVVVSSWNHQLKLNSADDPRLPKYISKYKQNPSTTPEYGATCGGSGSTDLPAAQNPLPDKAATPEPSASGTAPAPDPTMPSDTAAPSATPSS
ncbi:DUF3105 domain-containing protein [Sphaerisporangium rubeum]|uniref:DUF3105 domain-containing protein n=1 Tax=Sphaerisporangium rubeum TaxID=321317 RepID=A0A7X0M9B2_9ACTN|nr:DUF3105 domain-containing protein [Sphaerisporangium rubeum]MBB6474756.1 hypothetical protein [Sphaerisporangium rubeum]